MTIRYLVTSDASCTNHAPIAPRISSVLLSFSTDEIARTVFMGNQSIPLPGGQLVHDLAEVLQRLQERSGDVLR